MEQANHTADTAASTAELLKSQLERLTLNSSGQVEDVLRKRLSDSINQNLPKATTQAPIPTSQYFPTPTKDQKNVNLQKSDENLATGIPIPAGGTPLKSILNKIKTPPNSGAVQNSKSMSSNTSRSPYKNVIPPLAVPAAAPKPVDLNQYKSPEQKVNEKRKKSVPPQPQTIKTPNLSQYRYFICVDFEATCDGDIVVRDGKTSFRSNRSRGEKFENEIISFPCVIVDIQNQVVVDEFHTFIKPKLNPVLTEYCKQLTGITQQEINKAPNFRNALKEFETFFAERSAAGGAQNNTTSQSNTAVGPNGDANSDKNRQNSGDPMKYLTHENTLLVSDSSYDFAGFLRKNCVMTKTQYPFWAKKWVNLKKLFVEFYAFTGNENKQLPTLRSMVESAGLKFKGKLHSGMDDVENMAKLLLRMVQWGQVEPILEIFHIYLTQI